MTTMNRTLTVLLAVVIGVDYGRARIKAKVLFVNVPIIEKGNISNAKNCGTSCHLA